MKNIATASMFRRAANLEEQMIRSTMPRVSAADPAPLSRSLTVVVANRTNSRLVRVVPALKVSIAELAGARRG